ncbi:hypothetical protein CfE428DRAFT_4866 [Chthoniobacter flavus Ellin428]|uniref:Uncharacterized protein n=2 Tax=Chthoniobacter flavus TaxID=191863 RepID=B4D7F1_9BACT|nr:hypothetical protein CfE428DRAFT_4866 [Chthoniobacter flavus Ellin428]TCO92401.1 hypothetical protein EV701_106170 [Chthoniobacter flavus]
MVCALFIVLVGLFNPAWGAELSDPILGQWKWFTNSTKVFHSDGRLTSNVGHTSTWKCLNPGEVPRKYRIFWAMGTVDTLTLDKDENRLSGKNAQGVVVSGKRLTREDPDKTPEVPAVAANLPPSQQVEPLLEPCLDAILAPLPQEPQMPRVSVEKLRATLSGEAVRAKTPSQKQICQYAIWVCDALTNGMDERAQTRAAAVSSALVPSLSNGASIVNTMPLHPGRNSGGAGEAIRKKQKDERAYADQQAQAFSSFMESSAYKAWVTKSTKLREDVMGVYTKLVQLEAAEPPVEAAK